MLAPARVPPVHDRYELALEAPVRRGTACVNVRWSDKEVFDAVQAWLSLRRGRAVSQWDVFSFLLGAALGNEASELHEAVLFPR